MNFRIQKSLNPGSKKLMFPFISESFLIIIDKAVTALYGAILKIKNIFKAKASQRNFIIENLDVASHQTWKARAKLFLQPNHQLILLLPTNVPSRRIDAHSSSIPSWFVILFLIRKAKQAFPFYSLIYSTRCNEEYAVAFSAWLKELEVTKNG